MHVFHGHRGLDRALASPAIAVGNFDGVHLGHRHLLRRARAIAGPGEVVVLTFEPHPVRVLAPDRAPHRLCTPARKLELLAAAGVDACVVEPFDAALSLLEPADFAASVLSAGLGARHVLVGADFRFGRGRAGTVADLAALGAGLGFDVSAIEPLVVDGVIASSTAVRSALGEGEVRRAATLLGRDFDVAGEVVRGAGRGKGLGVPTANLAWDGETVPAAGIYAVWVERLDRAPGRRLGGAASLGWNPTFDGQDQTLEVHVLDFEADLYGERLRIGFVERLRGEERFSDVDALLRQIERDIVQTRDILARHASTAAARRQSDAI